MTTVAEIQTAVRALPENQFGVFSSWFDSYEEEHWDMQIKHDQFFGKYLLPYGTQCSIVAL